MRPRPPILRDLGGRTRPLFFCALGLATRLAWLHNRETSLHAENGQAWLLGGEALRVARAVAARGSFADSFFDGQGPTAHLLPIMPSIAGGIFALFGIGSIASSVVLASWALGQTFAALLLLFGLFGRLGAGDGPRLGALALLCLLPVYMFEETIGFRYWEGALALCLVALNLLWMLRIERARRITPIEGAAAALLGAVALFTSPAAGVALAACWAALAFRRLGWRVALMLGLGGAAAVSTLLIPWAARNAAVVGSPVLLRSNFGLEFAIGNDPAPAHADPATAYLARLNQLHPFHAEAPRRAMKAAGGEVAYSRELGQATWNWARANPGPFAIRCLRHYVEFYLPTPWMFTVTNWLGLLELRVLMMWAATLLGVAGLVEGVSRSRPGYWLLAIYLALAGLPYALVQPIPRYSYIAYPILVFLAATAASDVSGWARRRYRRSPPANGPGTAR